MESDWQRVHDSRQTSSTDARLVGSRTLEPGSLDPDSHAVANAASRYNGVTYTSNLS
ncbi:MAG: hypothetical protein OXE05_09520 [Chloroflexi bacterium]|nr:hypothetical protein [Chloroflexota bacterium]